jgi:hypothetical protein
MSGDSQEILDSRDCCTRDATMQHRTRATSVLCESKDIPASDFFKVDLEGSVQQLPDSHRVNDGKHGQQTSHLPGDPRLVFVDWRRLTTFSIWHTQPAATAFAISRASEDT